MDELEREEFFRLKKVQAKKKAQQALRDTAALEVRGCFCPKAGSMLCTSTLACTCPLGSCSLQPLPLPGPDPGSVPQRHTPAACLFTILMLFTDSSLLLAAGQ